MNQLRGACVSPFFHRLSSPATANPSVVGGKNFQTRCPSFVKREPERPDENTDTPVSNTYFEDIERHPHLATPNLRTAQRINTYHTALQSGQKKTSTASLPGTVTIVPFCSPSTTSTPMAVPFSKDCPAQVTWLTSFESNPGLVILFTLASPSSLEPEPEPPTRKYGVKSTVTLPAATSVALADSLRTARLSSARRAMPSARACGSQIAYAASCGCEGMSMRLSWEAPEDPTASSMSRYATKEGEARAAP